LNTKAALGTKKASLHCACSVDKLSHLIKSLAAQTENEKDYWRIALR